MPASGGYWLAPPRKASAAAASISAGPSVSGKPCPRLTEPVRAASADISVKIVVPNGRIRATSGSAEIDVVTRSAYGPRPPTPILHFLASGTLIDRCFRYLDRSVLSVSRSVGQKMNLMQEALANEPVLVRWTTS